MRTRATSARTLSLMFERVLACARLKLALYLGTCCAEHWRNHFALLFVWAKLDDQPSSSSLGGTITDITQVDADEVRQARNVYMSTILDELSAPVHLGQWLVLRKQLEQLGTTSSYEVNASQMWVTGQGALLARGVTLLREANWGLLGMDAHCCERYLLQLEEDEMVFAEAIEYMAMHALWDPPASARPCRGDIVVFRYTKGRVYSKGRVMLGQVEKVTMRANSSEVITQQHLWHRKWQKKEDYIKKYIGENLWPDVKSSGNKIPPPKGIFRVYAVREIIGFDEHGPISGQLYGRKNKIQFGQIGSAL